MLLVSIFLSHLNIDVALLKQWSLTIVCDDENPRLDNQKLHCLLYVYSSSYIYPKGHNMYYSSQCLWFSSEYKISNLNCVKRFNVRMHKSSFEFGL